TLIFLAEAETRLGRWRQAITLYDRALTLNPDNQGTVAAKAELHRQFGPKLRLDHDIQEVEQEDRQQISRLLTRALIGSSAALELDLERRQVDAPTLTRQDGGQGSFEASRMRGKLTVTLDTPSAYSFEVGMSGAQSGPGLHGGVLWRSNHGTTALRGHWRQPYWDLLQGIADKGISSGGRLSHQGELNPRTQYEISLGYNRYGIARDPSAATSVDAKLGFNYVLKDIGPFVSIGYRLDTEHVLTRAPPVLNDRGERFELMPVASRESHSGFLFMSGMLTDYVEVEGSVGYTIDRFNAEGSTGEVALRYSPFPEIEVGVDAGLGRTFSRGGNARVMRVGAHILLRGD
ncbi:MAG: tetratricopeptide repeat protein, partial [Gammaproteobacteria bacterium]|nr:tetratricopeptide repeat protein [Gammaproteobacteria bacterium]